MIPFLSVIRHERQKPEGTRNARHTFGALGKAGFELRPYIELGAFNTRKIDEFVGFEVA